MKLFLKVKTGAKEEKIQKIDDINYAVSVKARPEKGKANSAIAKLFASYFKVSPSAVKIISGRTSKRKIMEIAGLN